MSIENLVLHQELERLRQRQDEEILAELHFEANPIDWHIPATDTPAFEIRNYDGSASISFSADGKLVFDGPVVYNSPLLEWRNANLDPTRRC